jgi:maleylacetoacetate isomerase
MKLHTYFRSSAAYRVRIALGLKGIAWEPVYVHLIKDGGQHRAPAYRTLNPQGLVPALEHEGQVITQSMAMLEYLEETFPQVPLLPSTALARAQVRAFVLAALCEIHPLTNLRTLNHLKGPLGHDQAAADAWVRHWMTTGLEPMEQLLRAAPTGPFCFGAAPTLADVCLVPLLFSARRFGTDLAGVPRLVAIDAHCRTLAAFEAAAPDRQPDAA